MVTVNQSFNGAARINRAQNIADKSLEKLSSGLRINRAQDDAAGLSISEKLRTQVKGLNQAAQNIQDAINIVRIGEEGTAGLFPIIQRMRELVVQAANSTRGPDELSAIQGEIDEIRALAIEAFEIARGARLDFDGDPMDRRLDFQVGANHGETITVDYNPLRDTLIKFIVQTYGFEDLAASPYQDFAERRFGDPLPQPTDLVPDPLPGFGSFPPGTTFAQAFPKQVIVDPFSEQNVARSFDVLDSNFGELKQHVAYLGAMNNTLAHQLEVAMSGKENQAAAESRIRDVDMASEMSERMRALVIGNAAIAMAGQANFTGQTVLQLVRGDLITGS